MLNAGVDLRDLPFDQMYNVAYSEMYRMVELSLSKEHHEALEKIDDAIKQSQPDAQTGLPPWVLSSMPVAADGTRVAPEDLPPAAPEDAMPPPGAKPGKPIPDAQ